jgi:lysophospholipase L1-like esterase
VIARRTLLTAPALLLARQAQAAIPAATPIARLDTKWWRERHAAKLAEAKRVQPGLVWLGDSITQNFERDGPEPWAHYVPVWQRYYGAYRPLNLGFSGDATCHLLWRIEHGELDGIAPKAAVMLIGANNLGRLHWSAEDSVDGIEAVLAATRKRHPHIRILLLSVLPSDRTAWASQTTIAINAGLARRYGGRTDMAYQDVTSVFMHGGVLDHELYYDPKLTPPEDALHPTADGMARLSAAIAPSVSAMMKAS